MRRPLRILLLAAAASALAAAFPAYDEEIWEDLAELDAPAGLVPDLLAPAPADPAPASATLTAASALTLTLTGAPVSGTAQETFR